MKKLLLPFVLGTFLIFWLTKTTQAQCTPDMSCTDTLNSGEICPEILPDGYVGIPYDEVVTVIPPDEAVISGQTVTIDHITLNSVNNLPPGIQYTPSATDMYAPTYYCILINGTPTDTGTYPLEVRVEAYIDGGILGIIDAGEQVDDTSLSMTIRNATISLVENNQSFYIMGAQPNPFVGQTNIKYYSPDNNEVGIVVYDLLGNKIYKETMIPRKGINKFNFNGNKLSKGIYCYSISANNKTFTKKMIKN